MLPNSDRKLQLSVWILETETRAVHTVCLEIMVGLVLQSEQSSTKLDGGGQTALHSSQSV